MFLKGDRALSKLITLLISNKNEFNHFFRSRSSDIVLLKVGNLHQNAKYYEARNTERVARSSYVSEREARRPLGRAPQARSFLRAKRADFLLQDFEKSKHSMTSKFNTKSRKN